MRFSIVTYFAAPFMLLMVPPTPGQAQAIPSSFSYVEPKQEIGPYVGPMTAKTGRFGFGPSGGTALGVRYAIQLSGPLSFEGVVGVVDGTRDVIDPGRVEGDRVIGQADALITTIDARFKFSFTGQRAWKRLSPFIVFGGGIALDTSPTSEHDATLLAADVFDFGSSFFGTVGAGTRWFVTERIGVRGDAVFSLWKIGTPPGFSDPERAFENVPEGEWLRGTSATITLFYRW